jgi:hypothetical protein
MRMLSPAGVMMRVEPPPSESHHQMSSRPSDFPAMRDRAREGTRARLRAKRRRDIMGIDY